MHELLTDLWSAVEAHELSRPRTQQVAVGPSELASPCDRHLALRLQGWNQPSAAWLPFVGTAVHAALDDVFRGSNDWRHCHGKPERVMTRVVGPWQQGWNVDVGVVNRQPIQGTFDAWHEPTRTVVDFKVVGKGVLDEARLRGPSAQYAGQVQLYARGVEGRSDLGFAGAMPERVAIMYLPRNAPTLDAGYVWEDVYRPDVAAQILARAEVLANEPAADWLSGHVDCWHCKAEREALASTRVGTAEEAMTGMGAR